MALEILRGLEVLDGYLTTLSLSLLETAVVEVATGRSMGFFASLPCVLRGVIS
jgi:hypothetical protein